MRTRLMLVFAATLALSGQAFGEPAGSAVGEQCACAVPLASFPAGSAFLSNMQGAVQVTAANPGSDPSAALLTVGDSALVLAGGSATLNFGPACSVALDRQASLVIREVAGFACASVVEAMTTAYVPEGGSGAPEPADGATGPGIGTGVPGTGDGSTTAPGATVGTVVGVTVAVGAIAGATYFIVEQAQDDDDEDDGSDE
jgi:hypothetical protein